MSADRRRALAALVLPLALGACDVQDWFTGFQQQPSVGTWQQFEPGNDSTPFRGQPKGSVPSTGTAVAGFQVSYTPSPATVDSMSGVANPQVADAASLARGRVHYQINCAVCHGDLGDGNGALRQANPAYAFAPSIIVDQTKNRTDGYLYGMLRNGRGLMPSQARLEERDRWDVVNYVRGLQGRLGQPVETGPVGFPGESGEKLPSASRLGPTTWAPHAKFTYRPSPTTGVPADEHGDHGAESKADTKAAGKAEPTSGDHE